MTGRERVARVLSFSGPDRVPTTFPDPFANDIVFAAFDCGEKQEWLEGEMIKWYDEWGNIWARFPTTTRGEPQVGAIENWNDLETWQPPDFGSPERYSHVPSVFEKAGDLYRVGGLPGFPFAVMRYLRRMDNFLADVILEPEKVGALAEKVMGVLEQMMDRWSELGADAIMFCEDWGTQERLLVSPNHWVSMFKPMFSRLVSYAHGRNLSVIMHSCGWIWEIVPHLVECGVDCLQLDQPTLMGLDNLHREFGGKIAFWSPVDIQRTLQTHDPVVVRAGARDLIDKLGSFNGGFIAGYYADNIGIGIDPSLQAVACEEFFDYGQRVYGATK